MNALAGRVLLNVGCGRTYHAAWTNIDIEPSTANVRRFDVNAGMPFADAVFEACYCSHMLEHLGRAEAARLVSEMFRVLRPGGTIRIVVPDLQAIAQEYLRLLKDLQNQDGTREADYDWILLEMYDQAVRDHSGGDAARFLADPKLSNREFVLSRIGAEAEHVWAISRSPVYARLWDRVRTRGLRWLIADVRIRFAGLLVGLLGGRAAKAAYLEGVFRRSGEVHRWMYDSFSLGQVLRRAGFVNVRRCSAFESAIPEFQSYALDADENGRVRKPDSLFMEAERPRA
jgi:SAM-dependent methyltransferase